MRVVVSDRLYFHDAPQEMVTRLMQHFRIRNPAYLAVARYSAHGTRYTKVPEWLHAGECEDGVAAFPRCIQIPEEVVPPSCLPLLSAGVEDRRVAVPVRFPPLRVKLNDVQLALEKAFRAEQSDRLGHLLVVGTSGGKTIGMLNLASVAGQRTLVLVHRNLIRDTAWLADIEKAYGGAADVGFVQGPRRKIGEHFTIAMCQTVNRMNEQEKQTFLSRFGMLILDECFVGGTRIDTTTGRVPIEDIRQGDAVLNALGVGAVLGRSIRYRREFVHVGYTDGSSFVCTPAHPVCAATGWVPAGLLEVGTLVLGHQALRVLRQALQSVVPDAEGVVLPREKSVAAARMLWTILREEAEQSHAARFLAHEDAGVVAAHRTPAERAQGERPSAAGAAGEAVSALGTRLDAGTCGLHGDAPSSLPAGHSERASSGCGGSGRQQSSLAGAEGERPAQGWLAACKRVARVSRIQYGSPVPVYNLHVAGHPSYFAEGTLVHNCQICPQPYVKNIVSRCPSLYRIGGTATPELPHKKHMFLYWTFGRAMFEDRRQSSSNQLPISEVRIEYTRFDYASPDDKPLDVEDITRKLSDDRERNALVARMVNADLSEGHRVLLVTSRMEHARVLQSILHAHDPVLLIGSRPQGVRTFDDDVRRIVAGRVRLVVATEQLVREGVSMPPLDRLHIAMPMNSVNNVVQLCGRIRRVSPATGKTDARVTVYMDTRVPALCRRVKYNMMRAFRQVGAENVMNMFFL